MDTPNGLNFKGKIVSLFGQLFGSARFQPLLEHLQLLMCAGMNVGGATYGYDRSGEIAAMKLIRSMRPNDYHWTIFDVGAHRGDYARHLRSVFGPAASIFCFEPSGILFRQLTTAAAELQCKVFELALSDESEELSLFSGSDLIPSLLSAAFDITGQKVVSEERISAVRLDDFSATQHIEKIDFLKIDVEGFEFKVLKGAGSLITESTIDFVQFEFGPHAIASRSYFQDFFSLLGPSYRIFRILRNGIFELKDYSPKYEQYVSATNYLAISKNEKL